MLIDMHAHTSGISHCAKKNYADMIREAKDAGIDGFILTNHYTKKYVEGEGIALHNERYTNEYREAKEFGEALGFRVFFGIEITMERYDGAHVLVYGVDDEFHKRHERIYDLTIKELYEIVKSEGGIVVQAHPMRDGKDVLLDLRYLDGIELNNHIKYDGPHAEHFCELARRYGKFVTSGGDYHADTRRTFCGAYLPDDITDSFGVRDFFLTANSYELQLEDEPARIRFTR